MERDLLSTLAQAVLWLHVGIILFNVLGLVVIPLGAWRGWAFVRVFWWRALHLAILAVVAVQAVFAKICFLTLWQDVLMERSGQAASGEPLIERWVVKALFWPLPLWMFAVLYVAAWIYALLLWRFVPPVRRIRKSPRASPG